MRWHVGRAAEHIDHVDGAPGTSPPSDRRAGRGSPSRRGSRRARARPRNRRGHVLGNVEGGLAALRLGFDAEDGDAPRLPQDPRDLVGRLIRLSRQSLMSATLAPAGTRGLTGSAGTAARTAVRGAAPSRPRHGERVLASDGRSASRASTPAPATRARPPSSAGGASPRTLRASRPMARSTSSTRSSASPGSSMPSSSLGARPIAGSTRSFAGAERALRPRQRAGHAARRRLRGHVPHERRGGDGARAPDGRVPEGIAAAEILHPAGRGTGRGLPAPGPHGVPARRAPDPGSVRASSRSASGRSSTSIG